MWWISWIKLEFFFDVHRVISRLVQFRREEKNSSIALTQFKNYSGQDQMNFNNLRLDISEQTGAYKLESNHLVLTINVAERILQFWVQSG
jgi:hypothetical protein